MKLFALKDGNKLLPVDGSLITDLNIRQLVENPESLTNDSFLYLDNEGKLLSVEKTDEFFSSYTYIPNLIYTYFHETYGKCIFLDNSTNYFKFLEKVFNLKKITIRALSANASINGNVKLDFYINDLLVKTQTIATNSDNIIIFDTKVSGEIKIYRDYTNESDTLKDGATIVSCIITTVRATEV